MPRSYRPEFRRKVLDLVASGRKVAEVARLLGVSDQTIYVWRRQHLIDTGQLLGTNSSALGLLAPGERLPPTDQIAAALDVGEITVRRALSSLCQDGVLERRRGRNGGTHVAERPTLGGAMDAYRAQNAEVHALIDQRLVLECGLRHLAARNADEAASS